MDQPTQNPVPTQKHFKSFWPIMVIAVLSAIVGGIVVWAAFNSGLDDELNSLIPGASFKTRHNTPGMTRPKAYQGAGDYSPEQNASTTTSVKVNIAK